MEKEDSYSNLGKAKWSGWQHHYNSISQLKDECSKFATLSRQGGSGSVDYLKAYLNHLFTLGQNLFCFFTQEVEDDMTAQYFKLVEQVNSFLVDVQEGYTTSDQIPEELSLKISQYFNRLMRMAKESGLLIDSEDTSTKEPGKGLIGLR